MTAYVILTPVQLGQLIRGEADIIYTEDYATPGAIIAAKTRRNRKPTIHLRVTDTELDGERGLWALTVKPAPLEHEPRLLARDSSRGYVTNPAMALRDAGEAIDKDLQARYTQQAHDRDMYRGTKREKMNRVERELMPLAERMAAAEKHARANYVDPQIVRKEIRAMRHMQKRGRSDEAVLAYLRRFERLAYRERSA